MRALIFTNPTDRAIFWIVLAMCYGPELIGSFTQRSAEGAQRHDRGSKFVVITSIWLAIGAGFAASLVPAAAMTWSRLGFFWSGIVLMLAGAAFRWYAIRVLGRYFTRDVAISPGQTVVRTGPYRYVRHPSYSGSLVTMLGIGVTLTNWLSLLVIVLIGLLGYGYRIRVEEAALRRGLGDAYVHYAQSTKRLIPFVF